jgi:hypothetical protein
MDDSPTTPTPATRGLLVTTPSSANGVLAGDEEVEVEEEQSSRTRKSS